MFMHTILLDTNFVIAPFSLGVDVYEQIQTVCSFPFQLSVFEGVFAELDGLIANGGQTGRDARAAKALLIQKQTLNEVVVLPIHGHMDSALVQYAQSHSHVIVATQDAALRKRLAEFCDTMLVIRSKSYVALIA